MFKTISLFFFVSNYYFVVYHSVIKMSDDKKIIFNEKLKVLIDNSNERSYFLDDKLYNEFIMEVKEAK